MHWFFALPMIIPLILFLMIMLPIFLWMSFRKQQQASSMMSEHELEKLNELLAQSKKMHERIQVLESILDEEAPHWKEKR